MDAPVLISTTPNGGCVSTVTLHSTGACALPTTSMTRSSRLFTPSRHPAPPAATVPVAASYWTDAALPLTVSETVPACTPLAVSDTAAVTGPGALTNPPLAGLVGVACGGVVSIHNSRGLTSPLLPALFTALMENFRLPSGRVCWGVSF